MKAKKVIVAVGLAASLGFGMTACGEAYTGEGVVVSKDIEKKTKSKSGKKKGSTTRTDYEIVVDVPNSDVHKTIDVKKSQYETIQVGQKVKVEKNKIK